MVRYPIWPTGADDYVIGTIDTPPPLTSPAGKKMKDIMNPELTSSSVTQPSEYIYKSRSFSKASILSFLAKALH